ncbi:S26 family signal peptidase [Vibrio chaetopteri]|uniref:S26 family signal peptidase n=1 Tax=Vibrio chaetopteri TaxID=3016528 RepID=A0AAU8BTB7_9VIBR
MKLQFTMSFVLAAGVFLTIVIYLTQRFEVKVTASAIGCLPISYAVIDKNNTEPVREQLVSVLASNAEPLFADGTNFLKLVAGVPGDRVVVTTKQVVVSNQHYSREYNIDASRMLSYLKWPPKNIERDFTVQEGELFLIGTLPQSFDSRYWGTAKETNVMGVGYAIF